MRTAALPALALTAVLVLPACSGDEDTASPGAPPQAAPSSAPASPTGPAQPEEPAVPAEVPTVDVPDGPPPTELQTTTLTEGEGQVAEVTDTVSVNYAGYLYDDPAAGPFDESYSGGEPVTFPLDQVVPGFAQGITGMKVGGRRQIVIPPELGYGATGTPGGPIPPDATLVFVVDLVEVLPA